jgi:hypothetical protein
MSRGLVFTEAEYQALTRNRIEPQTALRYDGTDDRPEALAKQYGWLGEHTWNATGPDSGLRCTLVRDTVLFIQVLRGTQKLTMTQQTWLTTLKRTGQGEVYCWRPIPTDRAEMRERLSRKES